MVTKPGKFALIIRPWMLVTWGEAVLADTFLQPLHKHNNC